MTAVEKRARDERRRRDAELGAVRERVLAGMRGIKEEFGLSYGRLAEKTHYSRSSWERFLNGKQWPSRAAVQQLADVVGQDPAPLITLWEHAERLARRNRREETGPEIQRDQEQEPGPGQSAERGEREGTDGPGQEGRGEGRGRAAPGQGQEESAGRGDPVREREPVREERRAPSDAPALSQGHDGVGGSARGGAGPAVQAAGGAVTEGAAGPGAPDPYRAAGFGPGQRSAGRVRPLVHMAIGAVVGALIVIAVLGVRSDPDGARSDAGKSTASGESSGVTAQGAAERAPGAESDHPLPGCSGESCLGREPQTMNCQWDAKTVRLLYLRGLRIQLRHSAACQAVWGRLENGAIGDGVIITDKGSRTEESTIRVDRDTYTRMLSVAEYPLSTISLCGVIPKVKEQECDPPQDAPQP
ncbi:helix-turn-helix domain-containing protein [Streptomyces filamentosus]|uniref:helix-turn-helix domain-containing protein n=1 Tax=Streptomyces filamentosus TaxID=67294 RepID=UPI00123AC345|nr:helix-turn-helix transcriptional regulator [Streptomyces filamentosus]KAA6215786.1 XRE family transcriptional regulator [Streptomyces filamentosus]